MENHSGRRAGQAAPDRGQSHQDASISGEFTSTRRDPIDIDRGEHAVVNARASCTCVPRDELSATISRLLLELPGWLPTCLHWPSSTRPARVPSSPRGPIADCSSSGLARPTVRGDPQPGSLPAWDVRGS